MRYDLELEITPGGAPGVYVVAVDSPSDGGRDPAHGTTRLRSPDTVIFGRVVVASTSKVPLGLNQLRPQQAQFLLAKRHFVDPDTDTPTDS